MTRKPKGNKGNSNKRTVMLIVAAVMLAAVALGLWSVFAIEAKSTAAIRIPRGATEQMLRDSIEKYYGKDYARSVMRVVKMHRPDLTERYGMYEIKKGTSALRAGRKLARGGQTPVKIVINGFRMPDEMRERIAAKMDFPADSLEALMSDKALMARYGLTPDQASALFLNDTYELYWNSSPRELIEKIGKNYNKVWNEKRRSQAARLGMTPAEVMVICSIVDEETNAADEKGRVGRLYINRLKKGMRLQADPTVRYAVGDFTIKRVTEDHLRTESPYNTYRHEGLPPGPIRTVGVATIDAVLNSQPSADLYMCASDDFSGRHLFASGFAEHKANAGRYRKALDAKGIH